jgi:hypothetical protein
MALFAADATACGDKFLTVGRGTRFQRGYVAIHPSSITLLDGKTTGRSDFRKRLRMAGHRLEISKDLTALKSNLASGKYTVVLADLSEASKVESLLTETGTKATFLPVVDASATGESADALKKYSCIVDPASNKKKDNFLAVLDSAIEASTEGKPAVCSTTGAK